MLSSAYLAPDSLWGGQLPLGFTWSLPDPCCVHGVKPASLMGYWKQNTCRLGWGEANAGGGVSAQTLPNKCVSYWLAKPNLLNTFPWEVPVWSEGKELQPCP